MNGEWVFNGDRASVLQDEKVLEMTVVMAAQQCECTWHYRTVVKIVNFVLHVFYHNFFFKERDLHKTFKVLSSGSSGVTSLLLMTGLFENKRDICASTALRLDDIKCEDFCADWQTWTVLFLTSKNLYVTMAGAPRADSRRPCNPRCPLNLAIPFLLNSKPSIHWQLQQRGPEKEQ